jgi:polyether ionophore transport system permease protein
VLATGGCALAAGAAVGLGVVVSGGHMTFAQGVSAGLNVLPAELLFIGVGVLFFAFAPRYGVGLIYAFVVVSFVWQLFGALLSFPDWLLDLSAFAHVAPVPAKPFALVSASVMIVIGAAAAIAGVARFRHRDLVGD